MAAAWCRRVSRRASCAARTTSGCARSCRGSRERGGWPKEGQGLCPWTPPRGAAPWIPAKGGALGLAAFGRLLASHRPVVTLRATQDDTVRGSGDAKMRTRMACLLAWTLAGLAPFAPPAAAQPRTLTIAVGGAFTSMDPHYHNLNPNNVLTEYVFDQLVRFDANYRPEPALAVSWKVIDPTTWELKLRDGVKFHDGTKFTADDVVFTFARIPALLNSPSSFNFAVKPIRQVEVLDPL